MPVCNVVNNTVALHIDARGRMQGADYRGERTVETAELGQRGSLPLAAVLQGRLVRAMDHEVCEADLLGEQQEDYAAQVNKTRFTALGALECGLVNSGGKNIAEARPGAVASRESRTERA